MVRDSVFRTAMAARRGRPRAGFPAGRSAVEVEGQDRPHPVQRPAAAGRHARSGHPVPAGGSRAAAASPRRSPRPPPRRAAPASSAGAPKADPEFEAKRKKAEGEVVAKTKAEEDRIAAAKADNCKRARDQLRTFESGIRVTRTNDKGEREFLDDKQRADETRHAKDVIAADCPK